MKDKYFHIIDDFATLNDCDDKNYDVDFENLKVTDLSNGQVLLITNIQVVNNDYFNRIDVYVFVTSIF